MSIVGEIAEKKTGIDDVLTAEEQATLAAMVDPDAPKPVEVERFLLTPDAQRELLSLLMHDLETLTAAAPLLSPASFLNYVHEMGASVVLDHFARYQTTPTRPQLLTEIRRRLAGKQDDQVVIAVGEIETVWSYYNPGVESRAYYMNQIRALARNYKVKRAMIDLQSAFKTAGTLSDADLAKHRASIDEVMGAGAGGSKRRALKIGELAKLPPVEWHIEKHFPFKGFVCNYGPYGSGKSFAAIDMALCIATGRPYLGKFAVRQGPVCYIAAEGHAGIYKRIKAWMKTYNVVEPPDNFILMPETFNLSTDANSPAEIASLAKSALGVYPESFFIDTLARMFGGGDENSTKDMNTYVYNVATLGAMCGATTVSVHHSGKDFGKGARGAVSLGGACDAMIEISGSPKTEVVVKCVKQKDAAEFPTYLLKKENVALDGGSEDEGSIVLNWGGLKKEDEAAEAIAKHDDDDFKLMIHLPEIGGDQVTAENGMTAAKLMEKLNWNQPTTYRTLQRLSEANKIQSVKVGKGASAPSYYYREPLLNLN